MPSVSSAIHRLHESCTVFSGSLSLCFQCNIQISFVNFAAKVRRQPKPVKPKKMIRLENKFIAYAACNSGSSAVLTKDGEVYMFGKDTAHCDHASGERFYHTDTSTLIILGQNNIIVWHFKSQGASICEV